MKRRCRVFARALPGIVLLVIGWGEPISATAVSQTPLRTITTAKEAHNLSPEQAVRAYPIHLRAVATYYDPYIDPRHAALFVQDPTSAIFVATSSIPKEPIAPGTLLDVTGVSAPGDFAPIVAKAIVRRITPSHLPVHAPRVSLSQLLTGTYDGQWVEVEGVVNAVRESGKNLNLEIALIDGSLIATTIKEPQVDYGRFVDAKVSVHANEAPVFNRHLQMTGVRLFFPSIAQVKMLEPATGDPFALPTLALNRLLRYTPDITFRHRVHVRGRVSLQWPGRSLCIQDSADGVCVETTETKGVAEGEVVDLAGFPAIGGLTPTLTDVIFRSTAHDSAVHPIPVTAAVALQGEQDSKLVQIEGKLIGKDRASKDPTMVLSSGKFLFEAVLPAGSLTSATPVWEVGSTLSITGICSVQVSTAKTLREGFSVPVSFRILLRSPRDAVTLRRPSWWTAAHLLPVFIAVLTLTLGALGWVMVLRHRIADQSALIRQQNATLRELSFQDGLTRVANRRKFDETLDAEFRQAVLSRTPLSLLMMDIDHFKALNDEYGHQRGDECLAAVASALVSALLRKSDLVARYGGEEFAVILQNCDATAALGVAERMRNAVLGLEFKNAGSPFNQCVSVSVGIATIFPHVKGSPSSLVGLADQALYQSKLQGRNRTTFAMREDSVNASGKSIERGLRPESPDPILC